LKHSEEVISRLNVAGRQTSSLTADVGNHQSGLDQSAEINDPKSHDAQHGKNESQFHSRYAFLIFSHHFSILPAQDQIPQILLGPSLLAAPRLLGIVISSY
jgi:hypothetical protein